MKPELKKRPAAPQKPTIKILIYTDDPQIALTEDFGQFFGLGSMKERLLAHGPTFANLKIEWFSRNPDAESHATNKLDAILEAAASKGEPYDEIWFFGLHQSSTNSFSLLARRGGPESELNESEVAALTEWMKIRENGGGGGVLMTGDHSNENPQRVPPGANGNYADTAASAEFLGLGRALGHSVPRAGELRKWEGPPTYHSADSFSTICAGGFQTDRVPQQLELRSVNADGEPDPNGQPHPLFFYKDTRFIEVFPDHAHEGAVVTPEVLAPEVWPSDPSGRQIKPHVVALGRDARKRDPLNIVATYNGDLTGVGRIVADSTWHHYMNLNLRGFPHPAADGTPSDQIGQFYGNLAVWLAPKHKREAMARLMFWELARYTLLLEEQQDVESTGASAQSVLARCASPCEVNELIQVYTPPQVTEFYRAPAGEIQLPSRQRLIGSVLKSYHDAMKSGASIDPEALDVRKIIKTGLEAAFDEHAGHIRNTLRTFNEDLIVSTGATACDDPDEQWSIETKTDPRPGRPSVDGMLIFCLRTTGGIISGRVFDGDSGEFLSDVTGTLESLGGVDEAFTMTLNYVRDSRPMVMSGVRLARNFRGRFEPVAVAEFAVTGAPSGSIAAPMTAPGEGDTGTASGTQT